jgi:hypothetical protein
MLGERIGEAVAEIQPGWVPAFAEVVKGLAREMRVLDSHWFDHDASPAKQRVALPEDFNRELALEDNRELDEVPRGHSADVIEIIRVLKLPAALGAELSPYVADKYLDLWQAAQAPERE